MPKSILISKKIWLLVGIVILAGLMTFVGVKFIAPMFEPKKEVVAEPTVIDLPAIYVTKNILSRVDQCPGEIQAYQDVAIFPKVPGFIKWIGVDRGSIVKQGQLMVTMYAPEYLARKNESEAQVAAAKATLAEAESELESAKATLSEAKAQWLGDDSTYARLKSASLVPGVVASNDVIVLGQQVQADLERVNTWASKVAAAQRQVDSQREKLSASKRNADNFKDFASYLNLNAPFDGYITERNMHVGSFVGPLGNGAYPAICRIQQLDLLRIVTPVPERDTFGVVPGAKVQFSVSTFPGEKFTGTVARLGNYLDQKTRTMPVELNYYNTDNRILPGMFCEVFWPTRRPESSLFVPVTAVASSTLENFLCVVRNGQIEHVNVIKGQTMGDQVEVFGKIDEGEIVAREGTDELREGTKVSPILPSPPSPDIDKHTGIKKRPSYHLPAQ